MLAETAKLAIELNLTGNAKSGIAGVERSLTGLSRQSGQIGQGFKTMGAGVGVAFRNIALLAIPVIGGLTAGLIKSVREGQAAAKTQAIYANAVANSGRVSTQYLAILAKQRTELMNLAGVDDELIQAEQTKLIQMGATGDQVARITPLILDMSKATGKDLLTSSLAVGKAINGNSASLQRFGIFVDEAKFKVDPFTATMEALNQKFGGTTKALSGSLDARLGALRENLANVREEAGMKLLPALTKIVDVAGRKLVPAFGAFVDRILPSVISGLDKFAAILEGGGAERGIKGITDALGPMVEMLKIAAAPVKLIVDAFLKLPSQVQGVLIGAFAVNKLSGGLIGQGLAQVVKGALGGIAGGLLQRGGSPANPLFVADVSGGIGGLAGGKGGLGMLAGATIAGAIVLAAVPIGEAFAAALPDSWKGGGDHPGESESQRRIREAREKMGFVTPGLVGNLGRSGPMPLLQPLNTIAGTMTKLQIQMHTDFTTAIGELQKSNDPAAIAAAAASAVASIRGGAGSAGTTGGVVGDLKSQLAAAEASNNPQLAGKIREAIKQIEPFQKGRQWQAEQITKANQIVSSNKTTAEKVAALKGIEADLLSHQRTMASGIVGGLADVVTAIQNKEFKVATVYSGNTSPALPKPRSPQTPTLLPGDSRGEGRASTIAVKVTSSIKDTADAIIVRGRWGKTAAQAGGA